MANKVKKEQIEEILQNSRVHVSTLFEKVALVSVQLPNGFVITETSGAVDKENYDLEIGKEICMKKIKDKLWELEGYVLQNKLNNN